MGTEIERKFVVPREHHHLFLEREGGTTMTQAYLNDDPDRTVRIRIARTGNLEVAKMTVKGRPTDGGASRAEWEWPMPVEAAREMVERLDPPSITKTRHLVRHGDAVWEVDVVRVNTVANRPPTMWQYLVVAEFEAPTLEAVNGVELPPWVGREVTGDPSFAMSTLTTVAARDLAWRKAYQENR